VKPGSFVSKHCVAQVKIKKKSCTTALPSQDSTRLICVSVKTPWGQLEKIAIDPYLDAAELLLEVQLRTGLPLKDYKILYEGKWPVCPLLSLSDQAITEKSVLKLCHRSKLQEKDVCKDVRPEDLVQRQGKQTRHQKRTKRKSHMNTDLREVAYLVCFLGLVSMAVSVSNEFVQVSTKFFAA
jgi:hypothetical protein